MIIENTILYVHTPNYRVKVLVGVKNGIIRFIQNMVSYYSKMSSVDETKMTDVDREELVKLARRMSDLTFQMDRIHARAYSIQKAIDKILIKSAINIVEMTKVKVTHIELKMEIGTGWAKTFNMFALCEPHEVKFQKNFPNHMRVEVSDFGSVKTSSRVLVL